MGILDLAVIINLKYLLAERVLSIRFLLHHLFDLENHCLFISDKKILQDRIIRNLFRDG